jgi:glycosyltransferase involved in cell wall biosynthesis
LDNAVLPMLSVCIPAYNSEDKIGPTIKSIFNQDFDNYEIVVVDDGSLDGTLNVLNNIAATNDKLRVIHQENKGAFHARCAAFSYAKGEYLITVDADDYLCDGALRRISEYCAENGLPDVVLYDYRTLKQGTPRGHESAVRLFKSETLEPDAVKERFLFGRGLNPVWLKAIKKSLVDFAEIEGLPRISMADDRVISFWPMMRSRSFGYIDEPLYVYSILSDGMTCNFDYDHCRTLKLLFEFERAAISRQIISSDLFERVKQTYLRDIAMAISYTIAPAKDVDAYDEMLQELREDDELRTLFAEEGGKINPLYRFALTLLFRGDFKALRTIKNAVSAIRTHTR